LLFKALKTTSAAMNVRTIHLTPVSKILRINPPEETHALAGSFCGCLTGWANSGRHFHEPDARVNKYELSSPKIFILQTYMHQYLALYGVLR
jgi:hypothetical protein